MKAQSYSKRIALNFLTATAILILVIFCSIYLVIYKTVYNSIDEDLETESQEILNSVVIFDDQVIFTNQGEWDENEHAQIEVNPTFIQVSDSLGNILRRSPNLLGKSLDLVKNENRKIFFNTQLPTGQVRQFQMIMTNDLNKKTGYISVAIPLEASLMVLKNLQIILLSAFPFVLFILYIITRFIAQRSIMPVKLLTESAGLIRHENLNERIALPQRKDELYILTGTINSLLDRIEDAMIREKQFSSDASHELRTPLSVLKGTLELMIRKPRDHAYFIEKTGTCLEEVNRMSVLVDQLLLLARYEKEIMVSKLVATSVPVLLNKIIVRSADSIEQKGIILDLNINQNLTVLTDPFMFEQILENIFSNALKYSNANGTINIFSTSTPQTRSVTFQDEGFGMDKEELDQIFNRFYRADQSRSSHVKGYGLGLAIAKRLADLLRIKIVVESQPGKGSAFTLFFPM
jgi:signal transduction histidine kinase